MNDRIRKRIIYCLISVMLVSMLGGCGLIAQTGLDDNEEELVAEYAAGVLLRYSADKKGGLGNPKPTPVPTEEPVPEEVVPEDKIKDLDKTENKPEDEWEGDETEPAETDKNADEQEAAVAKPADGRAIADAIGISGFDMAYGGFEIAEVYPDAHSNDLTFSMQAAEGKKLLVVHMDVINPDDADRECDALSCNVKYRILINETTRINEQMTILLNDLKSYSDTIKAKRKVDTVLVFEVDDAMVSQINTMSLVVVNAQGESVFSLK